VNDKSLQHLRKLRVARRRNPGEDLPGSVLACKWSLGESWTVLEANLQTNEF
jgi:hypothetical protein